jgi:MFS family permease
MPVRLLTFLTFVNLLNYLDRYIVHSVEPKLKTEFVLSDLESGLLVSAFVFGYFIFSPIFGFLGSKFDKRKLMAVGLLCWSVATFATGLATSFAWFFFARVLVGIGEASFAPIVPVYLKSRVPDTVTFNSALSIFFAALPVGSALGFVLGGRVAEAYSWRHVFQFAAIPGIVLAFGFLLLKREASSLEAQQAANSPFVQGIKKIVTSRVLLLTIVGYVLNSFALNGIAAFVVRHGSNLGMPESDVASTFGVILVVSGFVGSLGGGRLASMLASRAQNKIASFLRFVAWTTVAGVPFMALAFLLNSPTAFLACCFMAELAAFAGVAPLNAVLVERAPTGLEMLTQGVTIFLINLLGAILAPITVGAVSDWLATTVSAQASLAIALQISTLALLGSGFVWMGAYRRENVGRMDTTVL